MTATEDNMSRHHGTVLAIERKLGGSWEYRFKLSWVQLSEERKGSGRAQSFIGEKMGEALDIHHIPHQTSRHTTPPAAMGKGKKASIVPVTSGARRYVASRVKTKDIDALVDQLDTLNLSQHTSDVSDYDSDYEPKPKPKPRQPFHFFALPSELRIRILELLLTQPKTIDLDPTNSRTLLPALRLFFVSRRMHDEASHIFYATNTFRVFALSGRFFHTKKQLLTRLPQHYIAQMRSLELRLGPGFNKPPKDWVVDGRLQLHAATNVRTLKVFVELDPASHPSFEAFRKETCAEAEQFFTVFCAGLLGCLFGELCALRKVEFDAYPGISRSSPLMSVLVELTKIGGKEVTWGPERGWDKIVDTDLGGMLQKLGIGM
ncbi:hypothetical protein PMIN06_005769 [Paraphaeosphaeria minitans]